MNCWTYYSETIDRIYWTGDTIQDPVRRRVEDTLARRRELRSIVSASLVDPAALPEAHNTPRTILVRRGTPQDFGRCPGTHGHLCCNYLTFNVYVGCTLGCTYCIMQSYLRNRTLEVRLPHPAAVERVRATAAQSPNRTVRVGTGEVGDSLLYDPLFGLSGDLIASLEDVETIRFEMKTKTDAVDHLPPRHGGSGRTIVSFSLNPPAVIEAEEGAAATLEQRLAAAHRAVDAGYGVAFHFDPMIRTESWRRDYLDVVARLAAFREAVPAWISLGTLRYPPTLRPMIEARPYGVDEFVSTGDGKMRYLQKVRSEMYQTMRRDIQAILPDTPVYLCMESTAVWRRIQRVAPDRSGSLGAIMRPVTIATAPGGAL
mgnify:CR=1 FL=1